jgi:hypothetical protein
MAQVAEEQMLAFARFPQPEPERPDGGPGPGRAAPALDPGQLRHLGEELIYRADPAGAEERERRRFERRHLSFGFTLEDAGTITGACGDTLSAEIIKTAVHAFGPPLGTEDTRTAAQRRMDGLTAACQAALDSGTAGTRHGAAPHLSIMVDEHTLAHGTTAPGTPATGTGAPATTGTSPSGTTGTDAPGPARSCPRTGPSGTSPSGTACSCTSGTSATGGQSATGSPLPGLPGPPPARTGYGAMLTARQVLALACRADLSVIRWSDGIPLDVGRRYRTETPAIRRALEARDQGCRFTGCGMPAAWTTAHHLKPWSEGGTTSLNDTALFCFVHHHVYIHLLGWTVSGDPNATLRFTHPNGWLTLDSPPPSQTKPRAPDPPARARRAEPHPMARPPRADFHPRRRRTAHPRAGLPREPGPWRRPRPGHPTSGGAAPGPRGIPLAGPGLCPMIPPAGPGLCPMIPPAGPGLCNCLPGDEALVDVSHQVLHRLDPD